MCTKGHISGRRVEVAVELVRPLGLLLTLLMLGTKHYDFINWFILKVNNLRNIAVLQCWRILLLEPMRLSVPIHYYEIVQFYHASTFSCWRKYDRVVHPSSTIFCLHWGNGPKFCMLISWPPSELVTLWFGSVYIPPFSATFTYWNRSYVGFPGISRRMQGENGLQG